MKARAGGTGLVSVGEDIVVAILILRKPKANKVVVVILHFSPIVNLRVPFETVLPRVFQNL